MAGGETAEGPLTRRIRETREKVGKEEAEAREKKSEGDLETTKKLVAQKGGLTAATEEEIKRKTGKTIRQHVGGVRRDQS